MLNNVWELRFEIGRAFLETAQMLGIGLTVTVLVGGALGVALFFWNQSFWGRRQGLYRYISGFLNLVRSFPFVVLVVALVPLTRMIVGSTIGPIAATVPLTLSAIPYFARLVEQCLLEVPRGSIEMAISLGASRWQIFREVLLSEARAGLILAATTLTISFISLTSIVGIVGGGGLGDLAIRYGYYRFQTDVMITLVIVLAAGVQVIQSTGNFLARRFNHR